MPRQTIEELYRALEHAIGDANQQAGRTPEFLLAARSLRLAMLRYHDAPRDEMETQRRLVFEAWEMLPRYSDKGLQ